MSKFNPIYFVPTRSKLASITFDDGPSCGVTDQILKVLDDARIKATFFMVGKSVLTNQSLAKEVYAAGHEIGIHSHRHKKRMKTWEYPDIRDEFKKARDSIAGVIGKVPVFVRAPYGNMCPTIRDLCEELNLEYIGWSINTKDYLFLEKQDEDARLDLIMSGSIVLFHDGWRITPKNVSQTIGLVKSVIQRAQQKQIQITSIEHLVSAWDDSVIVTSGESRILGRCSVVKSDGIANTLVYWHQNDATNGISYGYESEGIKCYVDIPPNANISEWLNPIKTPSNWIVDGHNTGQLFSERFNHKVHGLKLNLGCGDAILKGWENLDIEKRAKNGIKPWEWNQTLPYPDESATTVLIQHSLQHCNPDDYDRNFQEIKRVIEPGGTIIVKEADNRHYVWTKPGDYDKDGVIASSASEPEIVDVLSRNGFVNLTADAQAIVDKYGDAINRQYKLLSRHKLFVVEGTKPNGEKA